MQITVKLFASFRAGRFIEAQQEYPSQARVTDVMAELGIEAKEIGMIMLDGRHAEADQTLHEGARLSLFPLLGGG